MSLLDYIPEESRQKAKDWMASKPSKYMGCIGGRFTLKITETSLGDIYVLEDGSDDSEINLTDFDSW